MRVIAKLAFLLCVGAWISGSDAALQAQTVGWCASNPGQVARLGYKLFPYQELYDGGWGTDNFQWHDGGTNDAEACWNNAAGALEWCSSSSCPNSPGLTAYDVCALNSQTTHVDSAMQYLYFNPNGRTDYEQNGGDLLGSPYVTSHCCSHFSLNC